MSKEDARQQMRDCTPVARSQSSCEVAGHSTQAISELVGKSRVQQTRGKRMMPLASRSSSASRGPHAKSRSSHQLAKNSTRRLDTTAMMSR
ncbi:conserved hypothetical protein [Ricinus communis]|uniref:Uncharacterized protein n=1 Tax=Ricinus communis TaxID=3988 RepID=B9RWW6_RICCO|nr:conserved hypothetical protein [Ricinus communis]